MPPLHEMYYSGGASGYEEIDTDGGGWVNKFWGNRSGNISYVLNHSWVNGPKTEIEGNDKLAVYAYKDLVSIPIFILGLKKTVIMHPLVLRKSLRFMASMS